ncbi:hypothetical protein H5410_031872 [Solanum commersonii]|uniref:Uncharacterized protein n=1 Tax=Solanum commersonii TaxID=4109 RepID=A0A9J5YNP0_SOLCO|nr:hypothetical protein H5410_031872 [Solanum commersonii]
MRLDVEHLSKTRSNLLLVNCSNDDQQIIKYFNFWTDQENFLLKVKTVWEDEVQGNPIWRLHQKLKELAIIKELSGLGEKKFNFIYYNWNWSRVCLMVENFKTVITCKIIKWIKPSGTTWKLNTDGS